MFLPGFFVFVKNVLVRIYLLINYFYVVVVTLAVLRFEKCEDKNIGTSGFFLHKTFFMW
jgi:hypothetical protein